MREIPVGNKGACTDQEMVYVKKEGRDEKQEHHAHPYISCVRHDAGQGIVAIPLAHPHDEGGEDHEHKENNQDDTGCGARMKCPSDLREKIKVHPAVDEKKGK
jgi:hypothetical protein